MPDRKLYTDVAPWQNTSVLVDKRVSGYRFNSEVVSTVRLRAFALAGGAVFQSDSGAYLTPDILTRELLVEAHSADRQLLWRPQHIAAPLPCRWETSAEQSAASSSAAAAPSTPSATPSEAAYREAVQQAEDQDEAAEAEKVAKSAELIAKMPATKARPKATSRTLTPPQAPPSCRWETSAEAASALAEPASAQRHSWRQMSFTKTA